MIEPDAYRHGAGEPPRDGGTSDLAASGDGGRITDFVDEDPPSLDVTCTDQLRWIHDPVVMEGSGVGLAAPARGSLLVARSAVPQDSNFSADAPLVVLKQGRLDGGRLHWLEVAINIDPRASGTEQVKLRTGLGCTLDVQIRFLPEFTETSTWVAPLHSEVRIAGPVQLVGDAPVTIRSSGPAQIAAGGAIHLDANGPSAGPGGFAGGAVGEAGAGRGGGSAGGKNPTGGRNLGPVHVWPLENSGGAGGGGGSGASGGGGGGVLRLIASEVDISGTLTARGGDGDSDSNLSCSASGAGGSGGSIWIQAPEVNLSAGAVIDTSGGRSGGAACPGLDGESGKLRIDGLDGATSVSFHQGPSWLSSLPSVVSSISPSVGFESGSGTVFIAVEGGRQSMLHVNDNGVQQTSLHFPDGFVVTRICIGRTQDGGEQHCLAVLLAP